MGSENNLEIIRPYLLPNEDVEFLCCTLSGFIILSTRRFVMLSEVKKNEHRIEKAIPYDCISGIKQKKIDRFEISGNLLDRYGHSTGEILSFSVKAPREQGEQFQSTMNQCIDLLQERRNQEDISPTQDNSYLEHMPKSLTENAQLDLNTILQDQPIPDSLVHEAEKFLGPESFILEESLRHGNDKENGVLLAAGKHGYYWIKGKKTGRFMSNVIVDTIEWGNIQNFSYRWDSDNAIIDVTYSLTKDSKPITTQYQWSPLVNDETLQYPWLLQQMNGPWILADIFCKYKKEGESFHSLISLL